MHQDQIDRCRRLAIETRDEETAAAGW